MDVFLHFLFILHLPMKIVLQCERHQMEVHLDKSMKSHLDLSNLEISRLRRVGFMKKAYVCMFSTLKDFINSLSINRSNQQKSNTVIYWFL